jgi:hypothetical protein
MRRELGMEPGEPVTFRVEGGVLQVMTIKQAIKRIQETARRYTGGRTGLVDEFLRDRRVDSGE